MVQAAEVLSGIPSNSSRASRIRPASVWLRRRDSKLWPLMGSEGVGEKDLEGEAVDLFGL